MHCSGTKPCPACGGQAFAPFIDFGAVPPSGRFAPAPEPTPLLHPLGFEYCEYCGVIRQTQASVRSTDYSDVDRRTQHQLPDYAVDILAAMRQNAEPTDLVVEVGANDGSFLDLVRDGGFSHRLAIEPSHALAALCAAQGHAVENTHLTLDSARAIVSHHGAARIVICRHTLEHVPDPLALLQAIRALLRADGMAYIEVPATSPIVEGLFGHELWDEHLTSFSPGNLRLLARRAGLHAAECRDVTHRTSLNLMMWVRADGAGPPQKIGPEGNLVDRCATFSRRWQNYSEHICASAARWVAPVIALGASHPQSNFLLFTGLGHRIDVLVDDDARKRDHFVALPQYTPVLSTDHVLEGEYRQGTLLLSAFGYERWSSKVGAALAGRGFTLVDPLESLHAF